LEKRVKVPAIASPDFNHRRIALSSLLPNLNCIIERMFPMARKQTLVGSLLLVAALCGSVALSAFTPARADSTTIDAPGFKIQQKHGWFGRHSESYHDALGNTIEKDRGLFGRTTTHTRLFGSEAVKQGNNISVKDVNGNPLVTTHRTLFGGHDTHVDGNAIFHSFRGLFSNTATSPLNSGATNP
jgi:hypothetical protein